MKARKKPVVVDAVKFEGFHSFTGQAIFSDRPKWLTEAFGNKVIFFGKPNTLTIYTLEGNMVANVGDYIIRGVQGEFYPCKPDVFEETFEILGEDDKR